MNFQIFRSSGRASAHFSFLRIRLWKKGALILAALCLAGFSQAAERPNILLIMSDDMGFSDLGCYGSGIQTPNLDQLAKEGVRFTQFYNGARCCPTRASLMTGLYAHQTGLGHMTEDRGYKGYRGEINQNCATIAEVMRGGGYSTLMCGKWHISRDEMKPDSPNYDWPVQRGFEKFYGTITGAGSYFDPVTLCRQNTFITPENDPEYKPKKFYYTDAIADNAVRFLQQHTTEDKNKPFFMYVAFTAAHWPMQALEEDIAKYKGKFDGGFEPERKARFEKLKKLGIIDAKWEMSPQAGDWDKVEDQKWEARCMEVYAAMVDRMDQGVGRIVAQLKEAGQLDNTLIFFLEDNGGCAEPMGRDAQKQGPKRDYQPLGPNDLQPKIWPPMQTRDGRMVRTGPGVMPGPADTYVGYGKSWANVSDTPFREYKHWVHEGGISTPLIVHWPKGIPQKRDGKLETQPGHLIDIMATCVAASGVKYPTELNGHKIKPMEGVSLIPAFEGKDLRRGKPIFWEHESNRAVRDGKWKLVADADQPWELYDMERDRTEMHDLAAKYPERVKKMSEQWDAWAARADVLPLGAWRNAPQQPAKKKKFRNRNN